MRRPCRRRRRRCGCMQPCSARRPVWQDGGCRCGGAARAAARRSQPAHGRHQDQRCEQPLALRVRLRAGGGQHRGGRHARAHLAPPPRRPGRWAGSETTLPCHGLPCYAARPLCAAAMQLGMHAQATELQRCSLSCAGGCWLGARLAWGCIAHMCREAGCRESISSPGVRRQRAAEGGGERGGAPARGQRHQ